NYRGWSDLVGYKTPVWNGLQYYTTWDKNNVNSNTTRNSTYWENLLTYEKSFGKITPKFYLAYVKGTGALNSGITKDSVLTAAAKATMNNITIGGSYSDQKTDTTPTIKKKIQRLVGSAKYTVGKCYAAATFGQAKVDLGTAKNATDKATHTQIAVGVGHQFFKSLEVRATYANYKYKEDDLSLEGTQGNKANIFMLGALLSF
ncbi:MAG: porin, partial [Pseudomonadota bacterium]